MAKWKANNINLLENKNYTIQDFKEIFYLRNKKKHNSELHIYLENLVNDKKEINIIGGGCAALSLARLIRNLPNYKFNLFIGNKNKTNKDHFWGFWKVKINDDAYNKANHVWSKWSINTNDSKHILTSVKHPYCVIKRKMVGYM